ncbi:3-deoxy-D-manno-octulosonic acid transferase, partial [Pseudomonas syringae pv. tagetis]
ALLILLPRHPERFDRVHALCQQQGFTTVRRSSMQAVTADVCVLMGDSMGELLFLYALSDISFVGCSLVHNVGHNLLE